MKLLTLTVFNILFACCLLTPAVYAQETNVERWKELRRQCEAERERLIAPEREQAIQECITKGVKTEQECRKFYADYGQGGATGIGTYRQPKYHDLPVCIEAAELEKAAKAGPRDTSSSVKKPTSGSSVDRSVSPDSTDHKETQEGKHRETEPGKKRDTEPGKKR